MKVREAAKALGVHENTVRAWMRDGRLGYKLLPNGYRRPLEADVERVIEERKVTPLKIYMVQSVHPDPESWRPDYDTTHSAVVVAESEQNAIDILRAAPRLEVPETGTSHPTKGWLMDVMTYPLEFDPECDFVAVELDVSYRRVLHSHLHHGKAL